MLNAGLRLLLFSANMFLSSCLKRLIIGEIQVLYFGLVEERCRPA